MSEESLAPPWCPSHASYYPPLTRLVPSVLACWRRHRRGGVPAPMHPPMVDLAGIAGTTTGQLGLSLNKSEMLLDAVADLLGRQVPAAC